MTEPRILWDCHRFGRSKLPFLLVYCTVKITGRPDFVLVYKIDEADTYGREDLRPVFGPVFDEMTQSAKAYINLATVVVGRWLSHPAPRLGIQEFGPLAYPDPDPGREPVQSKGPRGKYGRLK